MAGTPFTLASTRHCPSPGSGAPAGDESLAGTMGVIVAGPVLGWAAEPPLVGAVSENCGFPPTFGAW